LTTKYGPKTQADIDESDGYFANPANLKMRNEETLDAYLSQFLNYMAVDIKCKNIINPAIDFRYSESRICNIFVNKIKHIERFRPSYALLKSRLDRRDNFDLTFHTMIRDSFSAYDILFHEKSNESLSQMPKMKLNSVLIADRFQDAPQNSHFPRTQDFLLMPSALIKIRLAFAIIGLRLARADLVITVVIHINQSTASPNPPMRTLTEISMITSNSPTIVGRRTRTRKLLKSQKSVTYST
jgi:hypothetical protein